MEERLIEAVDAVATCVQILTICAALLTPFLAWWLLSHSEWYRCRVAHWMLIDRKEAGRAERGFE